MRLTRPARMSLLLLLVGTSVSSPIAAAMAAPTSTPTGQEQPVAPAIVDVRAFGAVCDGITNDTAAIQSAADAATGMTLALPAGTCMTSGVRVAHTTVAGGGPTSVVKLLAAAPGDDNPVFEVGDHVTIQNVKIDGNRAAQPGHRFSDSYSDAGANYRDTCFSCGAGRGYQAGVRGEVVTDLTVRNTEITGTFGAAIATNDSSTVAIVNNDIHDANFEAAYIYGSTAPYRDVSGSEITITGNRIAAIGVGTRCSPSCAEPNGIVLSRVNGAIVSGNSIDGVDRDLVKIESSQNVFIDRNSGVNGRAQYPGIQVQAVRNIPNVNITITNNTISVPGFLAGVQINSSSSSPSMAKNITVSGNIIRGVTYGVLTDGDVGLDTIAVTGNLFLDISSHAIYQNGGGTNLTFEDNSIDGRQVRNVLIPGAFQEPMLVS